MNALQAIKASSETSLMVVSMFLEDLEDGDLQQRPGDGCQTIAWQLGHLVLADLRLLKVLTPDFAIELPEGFEANHSAEASKTDAADCDKATYLGLLQQVRGALGEAIAALSEEDLDRPNPNEQMAEFFPTLGAMLVIMSSHPLMHAGQWVPIRRRLGKKIVI